jgi:hypothetical protein
MLNSLATILQLHEGRMRLMLPPPGRQSGMKYDKIIAMLSLALTFTGLVIAGLSMQHSNL